MARVNKDEREHNMKPMDLGVITGIGENPSDNMKRVRELGVSTAQIVAPPEKFMSGPGLQQIKDAIKQSGVEVTSVFCGYAGEAYDDIPTVRRTVGLVPRATRAERVKKTKAFTDFAQAIGVRNVSAHIGFIPENSADPDCKDLVAVVQDICDYAARNKQQFCLETGQETAEVLQRFIKGVNRPNLKVNFDPANMLLYGSGEPIAALNLLGTYVVGVHCKDGKRPTEKDKLGHEMLLGKGDVGIDTFIATLKKVGYKGALTIEREISGEQQKQDILEAIKLLESVKAAAGV